MTERQLMNIIGLSFRAGLSVSGVEQIVEQIQKKNAHYVLIASDIKDNSKKQLIDKCKTYEVRYAEVLNRQSLGQAIGKYDRVAIAILDKGFAQKIHSLL